MSTSILYHGFGLRNQQCQKTDIAPTEHLVFQQKQEASMHVRSSNVAVCGSEAHSQLEQGLGLLDDHGDSHYRPVLFWVVIGQETPHRVERIHRGH